MMPGRTRAWLVDCQGCAGGKGIIDLLLLKLRMRDYLCGEFLDDRAIRPDAKSKVREVFLNHYSYRLFSGFPHDPHHDLTWQAGWAPSALMVCRLIEAQPLPVSTHACQRPVRLKSFMSPMRRLLNLLLSWRKSCTGPSRTQHSSLACAAA